MATPKNQSKEEPVILTGDALNEIAKMKNMFRACERIEEVMLAVQRGEARQAELAKENADLEEQTKSAHAYVDGTTAALEVKKKEFDDYQKDLDAKMAAAKAKFEADMAELAKHYSETSVAAREKVAADLKTQQDKVDDLEAKKSDLQRDIRMLEAEIHTLQTRAATLKQTGPIEQPK